MKKNMNKRYWLIPMLIVSINILAIILRWDMLTELLPTHFDLQEHFTDLVSSSILLFMYPPVGIVICLIAYAIAQKKRKLQNGMVIMASGFCLILLSSTMVTITGKTQPVFMFAEPVILLATIVGCIISVVKK